MRRHPFLPSSGRGRPAGSGELSPFPFPSFPLRVVWGAGGAEGLGGVGLTLLVPACMGSSSPPSPYGCRGCIYPPSPGSPPGVALLGRSRGPPPSRRSPPQPAGPPACFWLVLLSSASPLSAHRGLAELSPQPGDSGLAPCLILRLPPAAAGGAAPALCLC